MRLPALVAVGSTLLAAGFLTGCSGSTRPSMGAPDHNPLGSPGAAPTGDPLAFHAAGQRCVAGAPVTEVFILESSPTRDLTLAEPSLEGATGVRVQRTWVSAKPVAAVASDGSFQSNLAIPPGLARATNWKSRQPMAGASLKQGSTYTFFVEVALDRGARFNGVSLHWTDSSGTGVSVRPEKVVTRRYCR